MISTSSHNACKNSRIKTVAISGNRGKDANYVGECFPLLAPKLGFWKIWHENIGLISEDENNRYYVEEYYKQVLSKLNPQEVYEKLDNSVLLCYEDNDKFCHRHIVAEWFQITLGVVVPEVKINGNDIEVVDRPEYIGEYLKDIMEKDKVLKKDK